MYNNYMDELARNLITDVKPNGTICKSRDGRHFGVCVNHGVNTPSTVIAKRALDAVKMAMRLHGRYAAAEALDYLHVQSGDCLKVNGNNTTYTVLWITI